jgi:hypothetical protein
MLLLGVNRLLEETQDVGLVERFIMVNLAVLVVAMARRRLLASGQASAGRLADNLTNVRIGGGGAPWQGPSGSAGANLLNIDRGLRQGAITAGAGAAVAGRMIAQRMRERRIWHNTLKARRRGDRMAGLQHKTYYSDAPGGSNGPGPRYGYGDAGSPSGPGPRPGPGPGPRTGGSPRTRPGPRNQRSYGTGGRPGGRAGSGPSRAQTPAARAAAAAADGRKNDAAYWGGVDSAGNMYQSDMRKAGGPEDHARAQARYTAQVRGYRDRFENATGRTAPMHPEPWVSAGAEGRRPEPVGGGGSRSRVPAGRDGAPPARSRRRIHEVIVTESEASWRFPVARVKDKFANSFARARGERFARRRDLDQ